MAPPKRERAATCRDLPNGKGIGVGISHSVGRGRYHFKMTEARDLNQDSKLEPDELAWLDARLEEYRELLEYLRDH